MKIIRVFPRKTAATPDDDLVRINCGPTLFDEADEVHVSVLFTWDLPRAEVLAEAWRGVAPVKVGGPATGDTGGDFVPGRYVKHGYVMTSRGCGNGCWFCVERNNPVVELPVFPGANILDSNILACSKEHIQSVFAMLSSQKGVEFTGGLEAKRLQWWHCQELKKLKPRQLFFAYDTPDDWPWLYAAGWMLGCAGFTFKSRVLRAYVLCGYPKDTFEDAECRMWETIDAGFMPMAMLYRDKAGERDSNWMKWQRQWARPAIIASKIKEGR